MEYLGFWVTCNSIKPINEKIEAIKNTIPPTSWMEVCKFIGLVNYCRDMWERHWHKLVTLTKLTSEKVNFE